MRVRGCDLFARTGVVASLLGIALLAGLGAPVRAEAQDRGELAPPRDGPVRVQVSFLLVDLLRIRDAEQTIEVDVFVRLQWRDPRLAEPGAEPRWFPLDEIWWPRIEPLSPRSVSGVLPQSAVVDADGSATFTQRFTGEFGAPTMLAEFPFDAHEFGISFAFAPRASGDIELEAGPIVGRSETLTVPDWIVGEGELDLSPLRISDEIPPLPGFTYRIGARRDTGHYLTKVIFPLVVIVMMSWTVFWAPPPQIAVQFGFAATSILTVIAYRFALATQVPRVPYGTRLDEFLNGAFILAFLALVEVIVTARLIYRDRTPLAERVDFHCRWAFPLALVAVTIHSFVL